MDTLDAAMRAYATAMNTLDAEGLSGHLADDFRFGSQHVLQDIVGKDDFLKYLAGKLETIHQSGPDAFVSAEMGIYDGKSCVVLTQGHSEKLSAVVLGEAKGEKLARLHICGIVPSQSQVQLTGDFPGR